MGKIQKWNLKPEVSFDNTDIMLKGPNVQDKFSIKIGKFHTEMTKYLQKTAKLKDFSECLLKTNFF